MNCTFESMNWFNLVHNSIDFFTNPESIFESSSHQNSLPNPPFLCSTERKIIFGWTITLTTLVTYFVQSTWTISKNMFHWNICQKYWKRSLKNSESCYDIPWSCYCAWGTEKTFLNTHVTLSVIQDWHLSFRVLLPQTALYVPWETDTAL